jgi:hypothetical protein
MYKARSAVAQKDNDFQTWKLFLHYQRAYTRLILVCTGGSIPNTVLEIPVAKDAYIN